MRYYMYSLSHCVWLHYSRYSALPKYSEQAGGLDTM